MKERKLYQYEKRKILIWKALRFCTCSNLNLDGVSSLELIKKAIIDLEKSNFNLQAISRFFKNPAFPIGSGPDFVNAVVKVRIDAKPQNIWINCILLKKIWQIS